MSLPIIALTSDGRFRDEGQTGITTRDLPHPPRVVRPRRRTYARLPIIVLTSDGRFTDENGQTGIATQLARKLNRLPPTLFAKQNAGDFVAKLDGHWKLHDPEHWQWRVTSNERGILRADGLKVAARVTTVVHSFGFKGGSSHKIIDPISMYGHDLHKIWPGDAPEEQKLLLWATSIRDFCDDNQMEVRPTIGALSGQFLTDRRFYPNDRRKVPAKTNQRARENLPGNHYALHTEPTPDRHFTAWYLDQRRAHHYHARTTPLPCANSLYAYGFFRNLDGVAFTETPDSFSGLYCLQLESPKNPPPLMAGWLRENAPFHFIYSNELPHLRDMGYTVKGVVAAWGSHKRDTGIQRYATWAEQQLDAYHDAPWLKPLLLATYGTLATRATLGETIFKLARGTPASVRTGRHELHGSLVKRPHKLEPKIANVLHRGLIEAATRSDSIGLAHWLTGRKYHVLSIYADAVIVEVDDDRPLPNFIPEPWRLKRTLNHLQFLNHQAFTSGEMTKLPGIGGEIRRYRQHAPGYAPRRPLYELPSGRRIPSDRRI